MSWATIQEALHQEESYSDIEVHTSEESGEDQGHHHSK